MSKKAMGITAGALVAALMAAWLKFPDATLGVLGAILFWLFFWFLYYLLPGALLSLPFWILGRHRAKWIWWEFAILIAPYVVWVVCMFFNDRGKDLPNIVEMFWLGCAVALAPLIRVVIGSHANRKLVASSLIVIYCLAAIVLWAVIAPIPLVKAH